MDQAEIKAEGNRTMVRVGDWLLTVPNGSVEPLIEDEELARRLGYKQPRQVRELVKRLVAEHEIDAPAMRRTVRRIVKHGAISGIEEREVDVYELDEDQALAVAMGSRTPKARELRKTMRKVFRQVMRGLLVPADLRSLRAENVALAARVAALEAGLGGVIGERDALRYVLVPLREAARAWCVAKGDTGDTRYRSLLKDLELQVRMHVQYPASLGQSWARLPLGRLGDAQCKVAELLAKAKKAAAPLLMLAQTDMFKALQASGGVQTTLASPTATA